MDWDSGIMIAYKVTRVFKNGFFFLQIEGGGVELDNLKGIMLGDSS